MYLIPENAIYTMLREEVLILRGILFFIVVCPLQAALIPFLAIERCIRNIKSHPKNLLFLPRLVCQGLWEGMRKYKDSIYEFYKLFVHTIEVGWKARILYGNPSTPNGKPYTPLTARQKRERELSVMLSVIEEYGNEEDGDTSKDYEKE